MADPTTDPTAALRVEVVYAAAHEPIAVTVELPVGATLADAIDASGLRERFGLHELSGLTGIHGELRGENEPLRSGDRVEIYRPLRADPKDARRKRARAQPLTRRR